MQVHPVIIDCDAAPFIPDKRWRVLEHRKSGLFIWDENAINLIVPEAQKHLDLMEVPIGWRIGTPPQTHELDVNTKNLREEMASVNALNANVLDFLLANPHLIPDEWKKRKAIRFWGTIYDFCGPCVRYLRWRAGKWDWSYTSISGKGIDFHGYRRWYPAAILKG